jgi:hypothetical protein
VTIYYNSDGKLQEAKRRIVEAFTIGTQPTAPKNLIRRLVGN